MTKFTLIKACEERIVNAWPSVDVVLMDGWIIRFAHGYSGRANSASSLMPGGRLDDAQLDHIEGLFARAGLTPCIRLTPLVDAETVRRVEDRGYRQRDGSIGMVAPLAGYGADAPVAIAFSPSAGPDWIRGVSARQDGPKRDADAALAAIVSRVLLPAGFATVTLEGRACGFGMSVVDRGMAEVGSIILDAEFRGKGHGRVLVRSLMDWAARNGAGQAFLQVEHRNEPAISLYRSLGFQELYRYRTMVRD